MVVIRLSRAGGLKRPFFHVVVTDKRSPQGGRYIESVGYFNPVAKGKEIPLFLNLERIQHWVSQGAQVGERVASLIKQSNKQALAS